MAEPLFVDQILYTRGSEADPFYGPANVVFLGSFDDLRDVTDQLRQSAQVARRFGDFYSFYNTLPQLPEPLKTASETLPFFAIPSEAADSTFRSYTERLALRESK